MAVVLGTNSGFVTIVPTTDPFGAGFQMNPRAHVTKDISPSDAVKITQVGWYCNVATADANFEIGLYAADGGVVPGEAGTLLYVERTNAKGTTIGWKNVTVDWEILGDTSYWIGVQLDGPLTTTRSDLALSGGLGVDWKTADTLPNPYGGGSYSATRCSAFYALWEAEAVGTNMQINISDAWKDIDTIQINIGDVWKDVVQVQQNIGDVWKTVFG